MSEIIRILLTLFAIFGPNAGVVREGQVPGMSFEIRDLSQTTCPSYKEYRVTPNRPVLHLVDGKATLIVTMIIGRCEPTPDVRWLYFGWLKAYQGYYSDPNYAERNGEASIILVASLGGSPNSSSEEVSFTGTLDLARLNPYAGVITTATGDVAYTRLTRSGETCRPFWPGVVRVNYFLVPKAGTKPVIHSPQGEYMIDRYEISACALKGAFPDLMVITAWEKFHKSMVDSAGVIEPSSDLLQAQLVDEGLWSPYVIGWGGSRK